MSKIHHSPRNRHPRGRPPAWKGLLAEFGKLIANMREATDETIKAHEAMKFETMAIAKHARASADQATKVGRQLLAVFPKMEARTTKTEQRLDDVDDYKEKTDIRMEKVEGRVDELHRRVSVVEDRADVTKDPPL